MREKFLPIGSVVKLKGATKEIMIVGYCPVDPKESIIYDYTACLYPEGIINSNQLLLFYHDQIETIYFVGFENDEYKKIDKTIKDMSVGIKDATANAENNKIEIIDSNQ